MAEPWHPGERRDPAATDIAARQRSDARPGGAIPPDAIGRRQRLVSRSRSLAAARAAALAPHSA